MSAPTWNDCPTCPHCEGPSVGHAPRTRSTYLRCAGCGLAWYPSHEQRQQARAFTAAWGQRNQALAAAAGLA